MDVDATLAVVPYADAGHDRFDLAQLWSLSPSVLLLRLCWRPVRSSEQGPESPESFGHAPQASLPLAVGLFL